MNEWMKKFINVYVRSSADELIGDTNCEFSGIMSGRAGGK